MQSWPRASFFLLTFRAGRLFQNVTVLLSLFDDLDFLAEKPKKAVNLHQIVTFFFVQLRCNGITSTVTFSHFIEGI